MNTISGLTENFLIEQRRSIFPRIAALLCFSVLSAFGQKADRQWGELALSFEKNVGQLDQDVLFLSRVPRLNVSFGRQSFKIGTPSGAITVLMGGAPDTRVQPEDPSKAESNYFVGDRRRWRTHVPHFGALRYVNLYPDIDLLFYGKGAQLEHDFVLAPKADPSLISLRFPGSRVRINSRGELEIRDQQAKATFSKPYIYQLRDGQREVVEGGFRLFPKGAVGFWIGKYDDRRQLFIDPILSFSTYIAGNRGESASGIAVDSAGNSYVTGYSFSSDLSTTGVAQAACAGACNEPDAFVAKINPTGTALLYATYVGGTRYDEPFGIAVDNAGNATIIGRSDSADFPSVSPSFTTSGTNQTHGFVASLSPDGSALNFSSLVGGSGSDMTTAVTTDSIGNVYVAGTTQSPDFPVTAGTLPVAQNPAYPDSQFFFAKLQPNGTRSLSGLITWVTPGSGPGSQPPREVTAIAVDGDQNIYLTGTASGNFPTTAGAYQPTPASTVQEGFVIKLNPAASAFVFSTLLGGTDYESIRAIALDADRNVVVAGTTNSANFPVTSGAFQTARIGNCCQSFVSKLSADGSSLLFSTYFGAPFTSLPGAGINAMTLDSTGAPIFTGITTSTTLPLLLPLQSQRPSPQTAAF
ncbi:MAG TPA: SBBP repeat-containing protein, partial [Bryobacteraceae bacterium]|nr:SBBP repeat-containing protein [Bryobacteraceae bacterium]